MRDAAAIDDQHVPSANTPAWTHIVSSPLLRCSEFAVRTGKAVNLSVEVDDNWQEIDYGDWDGMPAEEWRKVAADQFKAFRDDLSALAPPNGESYLQFRDRVLSAWDRLIDYDDGAHLLVVTHGGVLRVVLPHILGMPLNRSFPLHIPFACLSRISLEVKESKMRPALIFHNGAEHPAP